MADVTATNVVAGRVYIAVENEDSELTLEYVGEDGTFELNTGDHHYNINDDNPQPQTPGGNNFPRPPAPTGT